MGFHSAGRSVFIDENFVSGKKKAPLFSSTFAHEFSTGFSVVIDTMVCRPDMHTSAVISGIRDLARELTKIDPLSFNLLGC
jgi:hypothetical protein